MSRLTCVVVLLLATLASGLADVAGQVGWVAVAGAAVSGDASRTAPARTRNPPSSGPGSRTPIFSVYAKQRVVIGQGSHIRGGAMGGNDGQTGARRNLQGTLEIFDTATSQTTVFLDSTTIAGFNRQPDSPGIVALP